MDNTDADIATPEAHHQLLNRVQQVSYLGDTTGVLNWDQQVMMPDGGAPARAKQHSTLSTLRHDLLTDETTGELLDDLEDAELTDEHQAVVRETRRSYEQEARIPGDLIEELARTTSEAQQIWQQAKADDDFEAFTPTLGTICDLHIERAEHIDADRDAYQVMFEGIDPGLPLDLIEDIFADLREALVPSIEDLEAQDPDLADPFADDTFDDTLR